LQDLKLEFNGNWFSNVQAMYVELSSNDIVIKGQTTGFLLEL